MNQIPSNKFNQQTEKQILTKYPSIKQIQTLNIQKLQKYVLSVQNTFLKKQLELYQWRQKTDFPIIKIQSYKVIDQRLQKTHIQVIINSCYQKINQIPIQKVQDMTTVIKQAFIGLQRLVNKFRLFWIKPQMIIIDHKGRCRVWINSNFSLNQVQQWKQRDKQPFINHKIGVDNIINKQINNNLNKGVEQILNFQTFFKTVVNIFQSITVRNPTSMSFYLNLKCTNCFIKGLKYIEDFIKTKKIKPNLLKPQQFNNNYNNNNMIKKVSSTPNLFIGGLNSRHNNEKLHGVQQQVKNMRQTIGYIRKKQHMGDRQLNQVMTFSGKNSKPLQKRLQQMIQQIPKNQFMQKNNILLNNNIKFNNNLKNKNNQFIHNINKNNQHLANHNAQGTSNLKKVFKSIKDFKFRKIKDQSSINNNKTNKQIIQEIYYNDDDICHKSQALNKSQISQKNKIQNQKLRAQTTRHDCQSILNRNNNKINGYAFFTKNIPPQHQVSKNEDGSRFSVTQTRSTSFFNNSGDRFSGNQNSINSTKKFGNIKYSEISHKKNSQVSQFNKQIQNILYGIDGGISYDNNVNNNVSNNRQIQFMTNNKIKKQVYSDQNINSKSLHQNYDRSQHNISILDHQQLNHKLNQQDYQNNKINTNKINIRSNINNIKDIHFKDNLNSNANNLNDNLRGYPNHLNNNNPNNIDRKELNNVQQNTQNSTKYGQISDEFEQPTAQQLRWKPTFNILSFDNQSSQMKKSIHHQNNSQDLNNNKGSNRQQVKQKKPIQLKKLDKIKNKQLFQSVMNQQFNNFMS